MTAPLGPYDSLHWAQRQKTGHVGRKSILLALAGFADERGSCFPGQALLAEVTEQSERTVRDHLGWLEDKGLIRREHRIRPEGRGRTSDRYYLMIQPADFAGKSDLPADSARSTGNSGTTNRQTVAGIGERPVLKDQKEVEASQENERPIVERDGKLYVLDPRAEHTLTEEPV